MDQRHFQHKRIMSLSPTKIIGKPKGDIEFPQISSG